MAPIVELSEEVLNIINPNLYTRRDDLEDNSEQIAELDRSNWIVVPKKEGNDFVKDSYAFDMSPARLAYSPAVEKVGKELEINYKNTSKDSLGREFIGKNNWKQSMMLPQFLGVKATNLSEELDYLHLLYLGSQNKIKVFDVSGKKVDSKLCEKLLMDSIKVQSPWRANWVDADYKTGEKGLEIHSNHVFDKQGKIINYKSEVVDSNTLMEDKQIDVVDYITKNHTSQGHVTGKVKKGTFYFWHPRSDNNSVAGFGAGSDRAVLVCGWGPSYWGSFLGVRAAKLRE